MGEMHWIQPAWSPLGWGSSRATFHPTDADIYWHTDTHSTGNTDTDVLPYGHTQTYKHTHKLPRDTRRHSFLTDPLM